MLKCHVLLVIMEKMPSKCLQNCPRNGEPWHFGPESCYLLVRMSMCEIDSAQTSPSGGTYMMEEFMCRFMARQSARCGAR